MRAGFSRSQSWLKLIYLRTDQHLSSSRSPKSLYWSNIFLIYVLLAWSRLQTELQSSLSVFCVLLSSGLSSRRDKDCRMQSLHSVTCCLFWWELTALYCVLLAIISSSFYFGSLCPSPIKHCNSSFSFVVQRQGQEPSLDIFEQPILFLRIPDLAGCTTTEGQPLLWWSMHPFSLITSVSKVVCSRTGQSMTFAKWKSEAQFLMVCLSLI